MWFADPQTEDVCEEADDDTVFMKDAAGHIIGLEKLNVTLAPGNQGWQAAYKTLRESSADKLAAPFRFSSNSRSAISQRAALAVNDADALDCCRGDRTTGRGTEIGRSKMGATTAPAVDIGTLIVRTPDIRGGRPRIAGTGVSSPLKKPKEPFDKLRASGENPVESGWESAHAEPVEAVGGVLQRAVSVRRIAGWYKLGLNPEEIADRIGHLSLAQVHAALAYYHANQGEIEANIAAEETEAERLEQQQFLSSRAELRRW